MINGGTFSGSLNTTAQNSITNLANIATITATNANITNLKRFVIEFCAVVFKLPLNVPPVIVPLTLKLSNLPVVPLTVPPCIIPLAVRFVKPLIFVNVAFVALTVPA